MRMMATNGAISVARKYWGLQRSSGGGGQVGGSFHDSSVPGGWAERQVLCNPLSFVVGRKFFEGGAIVFREYGRGGCYEAAFENALANGYPPRTAGRSKRLVRTAENYSRRERGRPSQGQRRARKAPR